MKFMRGLAIVLALCCVPLAAAAQQKEPIPISPEKLALIKELIGVTDVANTAKLTMSQTMQAMTASLSGMIGKALPEDLAGQNLTPEQMAEAKKTSAAFISREMKLMAENMVKAIDFDALVATVYIPLYDKYYTEQELRDLIAFYKTPTGQKAVIVSPLLAGDASAKTTQFLMPTMMQRIKDAQDLMQKDIQKFTDDLKRIGNSSPAPPPSK